MAPKAKITDDEISAMIQDYSNSKILLKDLVKKYGRKATTIRQVFKKHGIEIEYNRNRRIEQSKKEQILQLYSGGKTVREIATILNISHGLVGNIIKQKSISRTSIVNAWSQQDITQLEFLLQDRSRSVLEIAQKLDRSYDAIIDKICKTYPQYKRDYQGFGIRGSFNNIQYRSLAEKEIAKKLYSNFIEFKYEKQVCPIRQWTCDFYLPDQDLWVEYDGLQSQRKHPEYFQEKIDYFKTHNYKYVILNPNDDVLNSLSLYLNHHYDFEIKEIDKITSDQFLERVHYLQQASRRDKYRLGFYYQNILVGVVTFGGVANPNEKNICLNRCAILDRVRLKHPYNNTTSYIIAQSLKWLKKKGYRGKVISWSDPRHHDGVLYRACNFKLVDNHMKSDYMYIDSSGQEHHKSKCRVRAGKSELEYAKSLGLTRINIPPKQRWEFIIT